ncbi:hypothetical protein CYL18_11905 [Pradoshia eiseniae]|uniref:BCE-2095-like N-terminal domain-containing protein n=1 Tax=Pradoshia eiseniae TaxID=2064768 RepID=A0A2S7MZ52_9BACI|nr:hypothetical protein [Pradoshia eiseniae]PQD95027.1 hypothetical protein CYL18_11905 [Pradoshia eiseniae]
MPTYTHFSSKQQELITLFKNQAYNECHKLLHEMEDEYPLMLDKLAFWKASLHLAEGKKKEAVKTLQLAFDKGYWVSPEMFYMDDEFKALEQLPDFKELIRQFDEALTRKKASSRALLLEKGHPRAKTGIYALHMRYSNAEIFSEIFLDTETENQYAFGFAQSSQAMSSHAYVWDDEIQAKADIEETLSLFQEKHPFDDLIISGGSQGGKLAIELGLTHPSARGFIAVIPYIKDLSKMEKLAKEYRNEAKGVIIAGEQDAAYMQTLKLVQLLEHHHIPHKFISIKGMGHTIPANFTQRLKEAVDYILD